MKQIVRSGFGRRSVLRLSDAAIPEPGPDEVLIEVHAAGVGPGAHPTGTDLAGRVVGVGPRVTAFGFGALVFGTGRAAFAEYAVAALDRLRVMPATLSFVQAAALPTAGATALRALTPPGPRVLVIGAGTAVGALATTLAVRAGAKVTGTGPADLVTELGADPAGEPLTGTYDLIVDTTAGRSLRELGRHLAPRGTLTITGGHPARQVRAAALNPFLTQRLRPVFPATATAADLDRLAGLTPIVDRTFALADAAAAIGFANTGETRGAVVLTIR